MFAPTKVRKTGYFSRRNRSMILAGASSSLRSVCCQPPASIR